ncbi:thermonuclease family protein [Candidatus Gottesmanbacteria bacterium]|nr:thermonuclease family protein [Candidatus Gottesmanbacteria bacterium]
MELARQGLAKVTIYEDRRKLKYQDELLKAQDETKKNKRRIWPENKLP